MKIVIDIDDDRYEYIKQLGEGITDYQTTVLLYHLVRTSEVLSRGEKKMSFEEKIKWNESHTCDTCKYQSGLPHNNGTNEYSGKCKDCYDRNKWEDIKGE